jgi:hypothetical protein
VTGALPYSESLPEPIAALLERGGRVIPIHWVRQDETCTCNDLDCRSPGKHAIFPEWQRRASNDRRTVERWWKQWRGELNFGWVMGEGHVALDLDRKDGRDGILTLHELEQEQGPLPRSCSASTPTGGGHLVFRVPADVHHRPSGKAWRLGIEVRAGNSYIVVEPSRTAVGP